MIFKRLCIIIKNLVWDEELIKLKEYLLICLVREEKNSFIGDIYVQVMKINYLVIFFTIIFYIFFYYSYLI